MRTSDSPFVADWFAISLRWMVIVALVVSLGLAGSMTDWVNLLLLPLIIWNAVLTFLAGVNKRLARHREISLTVDILFAALFFAMHGGMSGPVFWVFIMPIITGAIYFEWKGALLASGLMTILEVGYILWGGTSTENIIAAVVIACLTLGMGALFGFIARHLFINLRHSRQAILQQREKEIEAREKKHRLENERIRAVYNLTATFTSTLNYERVLDIALDLSMTSLNSEPDAGPDPYLVAAVLLFSGDKLIVGSARRFSHADMRSQFPGRQGYLHETIEGGEPLLIQSTSPDPELAQVVSLRSCKAILLIPMRTGYNIYGVLLLAHPNQAFFTSDRRDIADILAQQLVIAIQNARLYQDLAAEKERMLEVQEEARKKLARDLHDGPTQSVSAIAMRVNLARRMLERDIKATAEELVKIEELARRTTKEIRHMLFTLRPLVLESQGLVAALQAIAEKTKETFGQEVLVKVDEAILPELEMGKQGVIFYIAEEAVNNARKHAQAPHIWIRLREVEKSIALLEIADDGLGFDVEAVNHAYDKRGSLGMVNLRERSELVNGLFHIDSAPGKGTRVQVYIPLNEDAADRLHRSR